MPNAYCKTCCVTHAGVKLTCPTCKTALHPVEEGHCPRAADGQHNPFRSGDGRWTCSRCNAPVDAPHDADVVDLGRWSR
jgi:hypothetical protein